jgi:ADP-ribose pyrophosphatase YjhB (NUDIX family)
VLVRRGDLVLAVTRAEPPLRFGLPGGGVEWNESFREGARRELFEETGLVADHLVPVYESYADRGRGAYVKIFEALDAHGRLRSSEEGVPTLVIPAVLCDATYGAFPRFARDMFAALGRPCGSL